MAGRCKSPTEGTVLEVSDQADTTGATSGTGGGFFHQLGRLVVRRPLSVIALWIALAALLSLTLPSLAQMVRERPVDLLPPDAPVTVTTNQMTNAFRDSGSQNILLVVLTNEHGLGGVDEGVYRRLVEKLRDNAHDVATVQDFISTPALRQVMESEDHKAWNLPVGLAGDLGTPKGQEAYEHVAKVVKETVSATPLSARLTGPTATVGDLSLVGDRDVHVIEIATALMVLTILLLVYRNPVTMTLPLVTIGLSLLIAQRVVAGLAYLGMGISNQTVVLMSGMLMGAGTDYAVFLISRYHEYLRLGSDSDQAVVHALNSIGKVITASAATVAVTFLAMTFASLAIFSTIGPALALSVALVFLAAVTLLPAILVLAGRRGWVAPRRDLTSRFWRRSSIHIVRRPKTHFVVSLLVLIILAGCASLVRFNYDDRKTLPASVESNLGYAAMDRHFPVNSTIPQYIFIRSPHDLRSPKALADLEQLAQRVSQLPGVVLVRGITRPTGETLEQAKMSYQAGEVGSKFGDASSQIANNTANLDKLSSGAKKLADTLGNVRGTVRQSMAAVTGLVGALGSIEGQFGGSRSLAEIDSAANLVTSMRGLGDSIGVNLSNVNEMFGWADPVLTALNSSPVCDADPACGNARVQLQELQTARNDGALDRIAELGRQLQSTQGTQSLDTTVRGLRGALDAALEGMRSLGMANPGGLQAQLTNLQQSADTLADASQQLADGVQLLVDRTKAMGTGLTDASNFLLTMKHDASDASMSGFYIPPEVLTLDDFRKAASVFITPDGHAARYLVQSKLNPFSPAAMDQVDSILHTAQAAQPNTSLSDASVSVAGVSVMYHDMRNYFNHDLQFIIIVTIVVVLLILMLLLRAIVAPLYLIGSVIISYMSALGIGVLAFQCIGGQPLSWSVPATTFIVLVAVGADYNMLLISRIRDESPEGIRSGVVRTVRSTGGVITSAGLIFAASMFGLLFGSIATMAQTGFIIGVGLLLDTFLVRTVTVPALAVLVGTANWWPSRAPERVPRTVDPTPPIAKRQPAPASKTSAAPAERIDIRVRLVDDHDAEAAAAPS